MRPFIANPSSAPRTLAPNVLTLLSTQPSPIPSTQKALEKTPVYMPAFKSRPFISHSTSKKERLDEDDWRAFYESDSEESDDGAPKARGVSAPGKGKRKEIKSKGPKGAKKELGGRVKQMTSHEGIWSLESLKAGFTSAWMGLLSLPYVPPPLSLLPNLSPSSSLLSSPVFFSPFLFLFSPSPSICGSQKTDPPNCWSHDRI